MKLLASRLRSARRAAGCTQSELARRLEVSRSAVAQWEREGGSDPSGANLARLALVLDCSYEWLATGRGNRLLGVGKPEAAADVELALRHFARSDAEERVLELFREVDGWDQRLVLELLSNLATRSVRSRVKPMRFARSEPDFVNR